MYRCGDSVIERTDLAILLLGAVINETGIIHALEHVKRRRDMVKTILEIEKIEEKKLCSADTVTIDSQHNIIS